tara:strand:+ start:153 stop:419 length:267 start_codon:yes stop_codon:yes gene_type:complete
MTQQSAGSSRDTDSVVATDSILDGPLVPQGPAARELHLSERTLECWRATGYGPPFVKIGRRVLYQKSALETWITKQIRRSTSDTGAAA